MRDIQLVLERWGVWATDNSGVDYSHIAAGFKGLLPRGRSNNNSCCDDDGLIVDAAVCCLHAARKPDELELITLHYIYGVSKSAIARHWKCHEREIRRQLQIAEGFIDGCLAMTNAVLEMDPYVQKKIIYGCNEKTLPRPEKCIVV
ncbi:antiterminator Q family protein [Martelella alba]|uniref:Antitermination protein Q n=1 Tax=Martelella alba TaxID=2590451 RepID=A0ABY2SL79_9HYPH|nr:antiterminator Q family protein [Martelella alba]TKI06395.1 antitermination protein Q [Martelella alba]